MQNPHQDVRNKISSFSSPSLPATLRFKALWFHLSEMLKDEFPEAIPRSVRRVGQLSGLPGRVWRGLLCGDSGGESLPSPLPLSTSSPSRSGAGTPRDGGGSGIRLSLRRQSQLGGAELGRGHRRSQEEGRGGAAPPGTRYKPVLRSEERARSAPGPGSTGAAGQRWRLRGRGGSSRTAPGALPGTRAGGGGGGGGCPRLSRRRSLPPGSGSPAHPERLLRRAEGQRTGGFISLPGHCAGGDSSAFLKEENSAKKG